MFIFQKQKKHAHIGFYKGLISMKNQTDIVAEIYEQWGFLDEKSTYEIVLLQSIHYIQWKFDYVMFIKKKKHINSEVILDGHLRCFVDFIGKNFIGNNNFRKKLAKHVSIS